VPLALAVFCLSSARNRGISSASLQRHGPSVNVTGLQSAAWPLIPVFARGWCTTLTVAQPRGAQVASV